METDYIVSQLMRNQQIFEALLSNVSKNIQVWKPGTDKWCLLEIVCHLYDEEIEDFRARVHSVLENPQQPLTSINPTGWVNERNYMQQDFHFVLQNFLAERESSVSWLNELEDAKWNNTHTHPTLGSLTAYQFLSNWLAHDYLHIRQITKLKYDYLQSISRQDLSYAGGW